MDGAPAFYSYYPTVFNSGIEAVQLRLMADIASFRGGTGFVDAGKAVELLIGSEYAREAVVTGQFPDKNYGAVVSTDEVAYTIRLLQIATAAQSASGAGLSARELDRYLTDGRAVSDKVPAELKDDPFELFFGSAALANAVLKQQEAKLGHTVEADIEDVREAFITRLNAIHDIRHMQGIESARAFTAQTLIALAMENYGIREYPHFDSEIDRENYEYLKLEDGSLLETILANFEYVLNSKQDWIICEYCGKAFKFQKEYDPSKRYRQASFCKNSCRVMAANESSGS
jgi:hypothetical protein